MAQQKNTLLILDPSYREQLVAKQFPQYTIKWTSPNRAVLEPKKQPSKLQATLFPMYKTRFKYEITFDEKTGEIGHDDLLQITFNRSNGATPEQQERIFDDRRRFALEMEKMAARAQFDQDVANKTASAPSAAA